MQARPHARRDMYTYASACYEERAKNPNMDTRSGTLGVHMGGVRNADAIMTHPGVCMRLGPAARACAFVLIVEAGCV